MTWLSMKLDSKKHRLCADRARKTKVNHLFTRTSWGLGPHPSAVSLLGTSWPIPQLIKCKIILQYIKDLLPQKGKFNNPRVYIDEHKWQSSSKSLRLVYMDLGILNLPFLGGKIFHILEVYLGKILLIGISKSLYIINSTTYCSLCLNNWRQMHKIDTILAHCLWYLAALIKLNLEFGLDRIISSA